MNPGWWISLGQIEYGQAWELQKQWVDLRQQDQIPDLLLLCEHFDVITIGRRLTGRANIVTNQFPIYEVERGGDATYHGPGQLVGYPIVKLHGTEQDPHQFLRKLEQALCQICQACGVPALAKEKYTGVWTVDGQRKLASLGVALRQGVTFHGFALNVTTKLSSFQALHPCGLPASVMTSLEKENGHFQDVPISTETIIPTVAKLVGQHLGRHFMHHPEGLSELMSLHHQEGNG